MGRRAAERRGCASQREDRQPQRSAHPGAILFIIFDLEAAFLFPWAVTLDFTRWTGWTAMMIFLAELGFGLAYAWKKGALEWE